MTAIKAVLFDLDGTLLDTAQDLGMALNHLLLEQGLPPLSQDVIRPAAGRGCRGLLKLGFDIDDTHSHHHAMCQKLLDLYHRCMLDTTDLFPGMNETLDFLEQQNISWGIVTNKPKRFTDEIVSYLQLNTRAGCVVSGDTLTNSKPHPEPILHACELIEVSPSNTLYIGDSEIDIIASKAAGVKSLAALYGYIPAETDPARWGADGSILHPLQIIEWIKTRNTILNNG